MRRQEFLNQQYLPNSNWLKTYYFLRAGFSSVWIALAILVGQTVSPIAAALLIVYPAWDAIANYVDAQKNGGIPFNFSQALNFWISLIAAASVALALFVGMKQVLTIFGIWAILAGAFQLITAVRRWKAHGAQWVMIVSGGQSVLGASHFFTKATEVPLPGIGAVVPYACLGALYFFLSAIWLVLSDARRRSTDTTRSRGCR